MQVEFSKLPKSRILLNVEVDADRVERAFEKACKTVSKKANVPGFRKGKVPRKILERVLGKEVITEEAKNLLLVEAYPEALKKADCLPVGEPDLDVKKFEEGNPMTFTAEFDVKPVITPPDYKELSLSIEKEKFEVKDKQVEDSLTILRTQLAETEEIKDRGIKKGDFADLGIQITYPDDTEKEAENVRKRGLFNEDNFEPAVMAEIEGMKVEETKEFTITDKDNAEKKLSYIVTVNSITELKLPELTDDFVKTNTKFNNIDELKDEFRREWERILGDKKKSYIKELIIDKLLEKMEQEKEIEIPEALIASKINNLMSSHMLQLSKSHVGLEDYLKHSGLTKDDYIKDLREEGIRIIKTDLLLDSISKEQDIQIPEEEFNEAITRLQLSSERNLKASEKRDLEEYMTVQLKKQKALELLIKEVALVEN